jgi:hypothetical protein
MYRDVCEKENGGYKGEVDGLLFYFKHMYEVVQRAYREQPEKKFTQRHREGYIKYGVALKETDDHCKSKCTSEE